MRPQIHKSKASRMEKTIEKLDHKEDCETIIEMLGLAGTHLVNGALHASGVLERDVIHSNFMAGALGSYEFIEDQAKWDATNASTVNNLKEALSALHEIEARRRQIVRGPLISGTVAKESLDAYEEVKKNCLVIIIGG